MQQTLKENAKIGNSRSLKGVKLSKINIEENVTLHNGEWDYLKEMIKIPKLENWKPIENNPPKLQHIKIELKFSCKPICDPKLKTKFLGTMRLLCLVHNLDSVKLFDSRGN